VRGVCPVEFVTTPAVATQVTFPDSNPRFSNNSAPGTGVGVGVGVGPAPNNEKSKRFGDPDPAPVTLFGVELLMIAAATVAGEAVGFVSRNNAATPATCGVAIDVPEIVFVAVSLVFHDDVMPLPGAKISRHVPKFENDERASLVVVDPTVIALATRAGDVVQASTLSFPAAIA
jgi:hypothetical protein